MTLIRRPRTIHICTMAEDQRRYEFALGNWLIKAGYTVMATSQSERSRRLQAAHDCDACIVLLGPTFGSRDPLSPFSEAEMEVSAAASARFTKLFVFLQKEAEHTDSLEQREFIERLRHFVGGSFQKTISSPEMLIEEVQQALATWRSLASQEQPHLTEVPPNAVMISSTGDLVQEREAVRAILLQNNLPVIDYLHAPSEAMTPVDRVISWARECSVLVLLLGPNYGYISPVDGLGITELEFVTAMHSGHPILVFIRSDADGTASSDQQQFLARVRASVPSRWIFSFTDTNELTLALDHAFAQLRLGYGATSIPEIPADIVHRWYRRQVQRWLGILPHLTQPKGMPLKSVYVSLQALSQQELSAEKKEKEDDRLAFADPTKQGSRDKEKQSIFLGVNDALRRYPRLLLLGNPGTGKSVTLRYYAINAPEDVTPVLIRLGAYARARQDGSVSNLMEAIILEEQHLALTPGNSATMWRNAMKTGKGLVLLDAFDEVPQTLQPVIAEDVQTLANTLPNTTPIVVTSRIIGFNAQLWPRFVVTEVQLLDSQQQQQLVGQWMLAAHENTPQERDIAYARAGRLLNLLEQEVRLSELARTPLLLTFLVALTDVPEAEQEVFPTTKAEIYQRVLRLLLARWGALNLRQTAKHLEAKMDVLLELARFGVLAGEGRRQIFTPAEFKQAYTIVQGKLLLSEQNNTDATTLLSELSAQDGILSRLAENQYTFIHPTFQEYLAATLIAALPSRDRERLISRRRLSGQWEEVTQFLVSELDRLGHPEKADAVVWALIKGDQMPVARLGWEDPLHLALMRAARCQGGRSKEHAEQGPALHLAKVLVRLASAEEDERSPLAVRALAALGVGATSTLSELSKLVRIIAQDSMSSNRATMIDDIVAVLKRLGPIANPVLNDLYQALSDSSDEHMQWTASRILFLMGSAARPTALHAIEHLRHALTASNDRVYRNVAGVLSQLGEAAAPAVLDACWMLRSPDTEISARGSLILREMYPVAIPALCKLLHDPDPRIRKKAASDLFVVVFDRVFATGIVRESKGNRPSIESVISPVMNDLLQGLLDPDKEIRHEISSIIGDVLPRMGESAKPILERLCQLLRTPIPGQAEILEILGHLATAAVPALDDIRQLLHSPNQDVRRQALRTLQRMGPAAAPALNEIRSMLRVPAKQTRRECLQALGNLGSDAVGALEDIRGLLHDPDQDIRIAATNVLRRLDLPPAQLLEELRPLLHDLVPEVRSNAIKALSQLDSGPVAAALVEELQALLHDSSPSVRSSAISTLSKTPAISDIVLHELRSLLHDPDQAVRKSVINALSELRPVTISTLLDLCDALRDPDSEVREISLRALQPVNKEQSLVGTDHAAQQEVFNALRTQGVADIRILNNLRRALHDPDPDVRAKAVTITGNLGTAANPLLNDLHSLTRDHNKDVRKAVALVLGNLGPSVSWTVDELRRMLPDRELGGTWLVFLAALSGGAVFRGFPNDAVVEAMGRVGPLSSSALRDLCKFLWNSEEAISIVTRELTNIQDADAKSSAPARVTVSTEP